MRIKTFKIFNMESKLYKIVLGIAVHAIYLYSIFDIYFTSPLVHGMTPHRSSLKPPAKRLVLFVADGLRADKLFENQISRAPFIRDVIFNYGRWGVSHTRVPTESRPGHVAIIAGFYEDVSAVAKGWKENPVEFDSVFNESRYTWSWGSPDILPMFSKGASGTHVIMDMYDATLEDFAAQDHYLLDRWVFEKVAVFFKNANESLQYKLQADQNVFFLHLLGIDTNGHAHRPMSAEYLGNIEYVDEGIKQAYEMFEDYFNHDKLTAYILTSDHGMTNWGSHGAGHAHETLTPLVAWGAGIHHPESSTSPEYNDGLAENWGLSMIKRSDVLQADIAPLMASLIGIPFPMNSVGVLPLDYLNNTDLYKTENIFVNAKQILAQFQIKERSKKESAFIFKPFSELIGSKQMAFIRDITTLTKSGKYHLARNLSQDLIELSLKGLNYYQKYDRIPLSVMVTSGFLGWIACVILQIFTTNTEKSIKSNRGFIVSTLFTGTGCMAGVGLLIVKAPLTHYVYLVIPLFCWHYIVQQWVVIKRFCTTSTNSFLKLSLGLLLVVFGLEVLVFSFFNRFALSIGLIVLAMWPLSTSLVRTHRRTVALWVASCVALAIFPMLPVVGRDSNYLIVTIAGILSAIEAILIILAYKKNKGTLTTRTKKVFSIQFLILILAILILNHSRYNISLKLGLPILNSIFSWSTLFCCIVLPPMVIDSLVLRLLSTNISLMSVYVLLCTSYEALFFVVLSSAMALWLTLEYQLSTGNNFISLVNVTVNEPFEGHAREVSMDDLRSSFFFVYFIITAFFGTGNIASINTFDPATVYCFLTVFSPFIMGALLILKILIPFVTVTCVFDAVHVVCRVPVNRLFLFVLIMTDLMALQFFYFVRDYGSWLEIGTSISHYVIMLCFIIFLFFIFTVANFFTRNTSWSSGKIHIQ